MQRTKSFTKPLLLILLTLVVLFFTPLVPSLLTRLLLNLTPDKISLFATIFLGIFIEALPFLLLGTLASGLVEVFVDQRLLQRLIPRHVFWSVIMGSLLGLLFPVCECGVVPLVRRLMRKGLPVAAGVSFLLAAPVISPVVILSTATAFGYGKVLLLRVSLSLGIAILCGLVFATASSPWEILRPTAWIAADEATDSDPELVGSLGLRLARVLRIAAGEFFEMGKYLVIGGVIAAGMQTFLPQTMLLNLANGPVLSVLVMMVLAVLLSICSTVDSFVALGFANTFSLGAIMGFLVFGPMVDIKSVLMYWRVFRGRAVLYLVLLPFLLSLLSGVIINFFFSV